MKALLITVVTVLAGAGLDIANAGPRYAASILSPDGKELAFALPGKPLLKAPLDLSHADPNDNQVGFSQPLVSADQRTVGWLSLYKLNCCSLDPLPRELVIYGDDRVIARIRGNELPIFNWRFDSTGTRVGYCQRPLHFAGSATLGLAEIASGKVIATAEHDDGDTSSALPSWAHGLDC